MSTFEEPGWCKWELFILFLVTFVVNLQKKLKGEGALGGWGESPLATWLLGAREPRKTGGAPRPRCLGSQVHPNASQCQRCCGAARAGNTWQHGQNASGSAAAPTAGIPRSRTHGPSWAGLPCGRLVRPPCIRRNPAPLSHAGEIWRAPDPVESPGQAPQLLRAPLPGQAGV